MALSARSEKYVFLGLWTAFAGLVILYWYAVTSAGRFITDIETLSSRIAEINATVDELRYEIRGTGGCVVQVSI